MLIPNFNTKRPIYFFKRPLFFFSPFPWFGQVKILMLVRMLRLARLARAVRLMVPWPLPNNFLCRMKVEQPVNWTQKRNITVTVLFWGDQPITAVSIRNCTFFCIINRLSGSNIGFLTFHAIEMKFLTPLLQYSFQIPDYRWCELELPGYFFPGAV